jgi:hypothetical protein
MITRQARISYAIVVGALILVAVFGLATPFLTVLFAFFALERLRFLGGKVISVILFLIMVSASGYGFFYFFNQSLHAFPKIAENIMPALNRLAVEYNIELPFTDLVSLKSAALDAVLGEFKAVSKYATILGKQFVQFLRTTAAAATTFTRSLPRS